MIEIGLCHFGMQLSKGRFDRLDLSGQPIEFLLLFVFELSPFGARPRVLFRYHRRIPRCRLFAAGVPLLIRAMTNDFLPLAKPVIEAPDIFFNRAVLKRERACDDVIQKGSIVTDHK